MTEENKKENIKAELDRASMALDASTLLFENGFLSDAISRLYYFMLHSIRALLLTIGLEPRSHEGVLRVFGLRFIKTGIFWIRESHIFASLMKYREEADYNSPYTFVKEDYAEFKEPLFEGKEPSIETKAIKDRRCSYT
jgi:uncharacterized protein